MNDLTPYLGRAPGADNSVINLTDFSSVEDPVLPLRDYWLTLSRHRWLIAACALIAVIGAALYTYTRTPLYTAEAMLLIERRAPAFVKVQDARSETVDYNDYNNEFYKTQYEILKSSALAEQVIRQEGLQ